MWGVPTCNILLKNFIKKNENLIVLKNDPKTITKQFSLARLLCWSPDTRGQRAPAWPPALVPCRRRSRGRPRRRLLDRAASPDASSPEPSGLRTGKKETTLTSPARKPAVHNSHTDPLTTRSRTATVFTTACYTDLHWLIYWQMLSGNKWRRTEMQTVVNMISNMSLYILHTWILIP